MSLTGIEPDLRGHQRSEHVWLEPKACTPTLLPLRSAMLRMPSLREQFEAADMHAGQHRDRLAGDRSRG